MRIDLDDRDILVDPRCHCGGGRLARELPSEDAIVGGERRAVVPLDALLERQRTIFPPSSTPPLAGVGISAARIGTRLPSLSQAR